jgi:hypothetical protein
MDELSIPQQSDDSAGKGSRRSGGENHRAEQPRRGRPRIASEENCLAALTQLGSLATLGMLTTAQVNAIRGIYSTLLQYHQRQQSGPARTVGNEQELVRQLRKNPELANLLEPLLTKEQIEMLLRGDMDTEAAEEAEDAEGEDAEDEDAEEAEEADDVDEFP